MKTSLEKIITEDGLVLHGVLYEPEEPTDTVLVHVHGMAGNFYENPYLDFLATTLTDNGIAFCAFNNRGNGNVTDFLRIKDEKKDYVVYGTSGEKFEDCVFDINAHVDFVKEKGYKKIHLSGHSLGAPKVAYFASQFPEDLTSLIFMSPSDMLGLARDNSDQFEKEITAAEKLAEEGREGELLPDYIWGEHPITARTYLNLFNNESKAGIFNFHDKTLGFETLSKITTPTLAFMGRRDDVLLIPIEEIMETIKTEMKSSAKVKTEIVGDADHNYLDHEQMMADILKDWIISN